MKVIRYVCTLNYQKCRVFVIFRNHNNCKCNYTLNLFYTKIILFLFLSEYLKSLPFKQYNQCTTEFFPNFFHFTITDHESFFEKISGMHYKYGTHSLYKIRTVPVFIQQPISSYSVEFSSFLQIVCVLRYHKNIIFKHQYFLLFYYFLNF